MMDVSTTIFFGLFAGIAVTAALVMLTRKTALGGAICLVVCFLAFSGLYAMLDAPFVAVMQVVVYAGAIMMLIIFVIMTVDTDAESLHEERGTIIGAIIATIIVGTGITVYELALNLASPLGRDPAAAAAAKGTVAAIGSILFTRHVLNFEMLSLLLLIALAGALILAKNRKTKQGA
jgi:NADH-quinone oxidoreductase subunit J